MLRFVQGHGSLIAVSNAVGDRTGINIEMVTLPSNQTHLAPRAPVGLVRLEWGQAHLVD